MALRPIYYNSYMTPRQILHIFHDSVVSQFPEKTWAQIKPTTYRILSMLKDEIYVSCFHVAVRSFETNLEAEVLKRWNNRRNAVAFHFWFYLWKSLKRVTISSLGVGLGRKNETGVGEGRKVSSFSRLLLPLTRPNFPTLKFSIAVTRPTPRGSTLRSFIPVLAPKSNPLPFYKPFLT